MTTKVLSWDVDEVTYKLLRTLVRFGVIKFGGMIEVHIDRVGEYRFEVSYK